MIGIDIVSIDRIKKCHDKFGEKAYRRFLSEDEIKLIKSHQNAAGFWAAKEAASKALGCGICKECSFFDIKISKTKNGSPKITLSDHLIKQFNIKNISLSISHDGGFAVAAVMILCD